LVCAPDVTPTSKTPACHPAADLAYLSARVGDSTKTSVQKAVSQQIIDIQVAPNDARLYYLCY
jgi:hypothetical protein